MSNSQLLYTSQAAKLLGITVSAFRRITNAKGVIPVSCDKNPHHGKGKDAFFWEKGQIIELMQCEEVQFSREASHPEAMPKRYIESFQVKYQSPDNALVDVCEAITSLHHFQGMTQCNKAQSDIIQSLKQSLTKRFCELNLIDHCRTAEDLMKKKICSPQSGDTGLKVKSQCQICSGKNVYAMDPPHGTVWFSMSVGAHQFTWCLPDFLVTWEIPESLLATTFNRKSSSMPTRKLTKRQFVKAEALIRFYLQETSPLQAC